MQNKKESIRSITRYNKVNCIFISAITARDNKEARAKLPMRVKSLTEASKEARVISRTHLTRFSPECAVCLCTRVPVSLLLCVYVALNCGNFSRENRDRALGRTRRINTKYQYSCATRLIIITRTL